MVSLIATLNQLANKKFRIGSALALAIGGLAWIQPALAEGSRTLFPATATGSRANIEWRDGTAGLWGGQLFRRSLFRVYAQAGESILLGSSAVAPGGDILVYSPGVVPLTPVGNEPVTLAGATLSCRTAQPGTGQITSRVQELAGPLPAVGGYTPCTFVAPTTGIYTVVFYGPAGFASNVDGPTGLLDAPGNYTVAQGSTIAAWDVTVLSAGGVEQPGRLFTFYLNAFTGGNGRPLSSSVYPVTADGYRYRTDFNNLDPNGFVVYGNQVGFRDPNGQPLYRDLLGSDALLQVPVGGVQFALPEFPIFFNPADPLVLAALSIPLSPVAPQVLGASFSGPAGGNRTFVGTGGSFSINVNVNVTGTIELVISRDGVDFDPTNPQNRVIRQIATASGPQPVVWDGLDNLGNPFPVNTNAVPNYPVRIRLNSGMYHFPLLDAENSTQGGPSITLLNPPGAFQAGFGPNTAFYDDRGYRLSNGTIVGTGFNGTLCPAGSQSTLTQPNPAFSDTTTGYNSLTNQRRFGTATGGNTNTSCTGSFGDVKGLDLWTFYPSNFLFTNVVVIAPPPRITKSIRWLRDNDGSGTPTTGDDVQYTIIVSNPSANASIPGVVVGDIIPIQIQVLRGASDPITVSAGFSLSPTLPASSFNGTGVTPVTFTNPGTLPPSGTVTVNYNARILPGAPSPIVNQARANYTGDNGVPIVSDASDSVNPTQPGSGTNPGNPGSIASGGNVNQPNAGPTDPTVFNFITPVNPAGTKAVQLVADADNSGSVTTGDTVEYRVSYTNTSPNPVNGFQVTDSLNTTLLQFVPGSYQFTASAGTTVPPNPNFNGGSDPNLTGVGVLPGNGGNVTMRFRAVILAPANTQIPNQAIGQAPGGINVPTDALTTPGDVPQTLGGNSDITVITVTSPQPRLRLVKRITGLFRNGAPISGVDLTQFVNDSADTTAFQQAGFIPRGIPQLVSSTPLVTGDQVEYTVYFLSDGVSPAIATNLCDPIPVSTSFVTGSSQAQPAGSPSPVAAGSFFSPLAPLPPDNSCPDQANPNGAVLFDLGNISNLTGQNFGFVRFRVSVN